MEHITLANTKFKPVGSSTIEHDYLLIDVLNAAGLTALEKTEAEDDNVFAARLIAMIVRSNSLFKLLALLIMPADATTWTADIAAETEATLKTVSAKDEKEAISAILVSALITFFQSGLITLKITPSFTAE